MTGSQVGYTININEHIDPRDPNRTIHILLDEPITAGIDDFIQTDVEANTSVNYLFNYCQPTQKKIFQNFEDYVDETETEKQKTVASIPTINEKLSTTEEVVLAVTISSFIYLLYKI
jgi:hypothetical protein